MKKYYIIKDMCSNKYYVGNYGIDSWQKESHAAEFYSTKKEARRFIFENLENGLYQVIVIYKKD